MDDNEVDADGPPPLMDISDDKEDDEEDDEELEDDEEDLEIANMVAQLEKSWEPAREGAPRQEAIDEEIGANGPPPLMDVSDDEDDDEEDRAPRQGVDNSGTDNPPPPVDVSDDEDQVPHQAVDNSDAIFIDEGPTRRPEVDRFIIGDGYGVKPVVRIRYNDKYPSARAGQPLMHEESRDHAYGAALGSGDNPWAPFKSKKDWEIARWAKLRGAGSTAFSELLAIDGVCFN
jgi:hypothetical protein